jgi:lysozyme family protein
MSDDDIISAILEREGGYVDHPADRGGPTKFGVTLRTLEAWRGRKLTVEDVRNLSAAEARLIYRRRFIEQPGFHRVTSGRLRALLVDAAVHHGPRRAVQLLQRTLGVAADGVFGPRTLRALRRADARRVYIGLCAERVRLYGRLIASDPSQAAFARGWLNRAAELIEEAA